MREDSGFLMWSQNQRISVRMPVITALEKKWIQVRFISVSYNNFHRFWVKKSFFLPNVFGPSHAGHDQGGRNQVQPSVHHGEWRGGRGGVGQQAPLLPVHPLLKLQMTPLGSQGWRTEGDSWWLNKQISDFPMSRQLPSDWQFLLWLTVRPSSVSLS